MKFKGQCVGVSLDKRGIEDDHILISLLIEDDEEWFKKLSISSSWLDEMIDVLNQAKEFVKTQEPDIIDNVQYGFKFK